MDKKDILAEFMKDMPKCKQREDEELIVVNSIHDEYVYMQQHYPEYDQKCQWLSVDNKTKKDCDIILIEKDGDKKYLYFDISGFFGK